MERGLKSGLSAWEAVYIGIPFYSLYYSAVFFIMGHAIYIAVPFQQQAWGKEQKVSRLPPAIYI